MNLSEVRICHHNRTNPPQVLVVPAHRSDYDESPLSGRMARTPTASVPYRLMSRSQAAGTPSRSPLLSVHNRLQSGDFFIRDLARLSMSVVRETACMRCRTRDDDGADSRTSVRRRDRFSRIGSTSLNRDYLRTENRIMIRGYLRFQILSERVRARTWF